MPGCLKLQLREKAWFDSSVRSRSQFVGPAPRLPTLHSSSTKSKLAPSQGPVDAFCLVLLHPEEVDYLHLKKNQRVIFTRASSNSIIESDSNETWNQLEVNP
ncbi:hypothetical protein GOP47_0029890 [Adiantum capillus-veneris]|nr:hypothetical protein GOP47_0029890 [Adiantum capillus-veneris]